MKPVVVLTERNTVVLTAMKKEDALIQTVQMLKVFQQHRGDAIVIPGRGRHRSPSVLSESRCTAGDPPWAAWGASFAWPAPLRPERKVVV
jgi:hypothetical protein